MGGSMKIEAFIEKLKIMFRGIEIEEKEYEYLINFRQEKYSLKKSDVENILEKYSKLKISEETILYDSNYFEMIIDENRLILRNDRYNLIDEKNDIHYCNF
jgi:hypothetical protein